KALLFNERHLVDFFHAGDDAADLGQPAFTQSGHVFFAGHPPRFRSWAAIYDHFADAIGEIQQFADGGTPVIPGAGAFEASAAFGEGDSGPLRGIQTQFLKFRVAIPLGPLAVGADHAHQTLGHDAIEGGNEVVRLDAHVDEASDDVGNVVGVDGGEHQVTGKSGLNGDLCGFLVADSADHELVRIVAQNGTQAASKGHALFLVDRNLGDTAQLIFDGIFNGDDLVFVGLDFVDGGIQGGGLARSGGAGDQHHAIRLANIATEAAHL